MKYEDWLPLYEAIVKDMNYSVIDDNNSARLCVALTKNSDLIEPYDIVFKKRTVIIGPASPDLNNLDCATIIAAGSASSLLYDAGIVPDIIVTDLDGDIEKQIELCNKGAITFIHSHGDNIDLITNHISNFKGSIVLTTQSKPFGPLYCFGGFTDGDRAVCIAKELTNSIELRGFDFSEPVWKFNSNNEVKKKKLAWAEKIIGIVAPELLSKHNSE